jgi:hypothetical protein
MSLRLKETNKSDKKRSLEATLGLNMLKFPPGFFGENFSKNMELKTIKRK